MRWITKLRLRLRSLLQRRRVEEELDEELRFHLASLTEELEQLSGNVRPTLLLLLGAVGLVLLIASANVANLLLAKASGRRKEMAVRAALGAGRFRLMRQLLTEGLVLSLGGALLGVSLAAWTVRQLTPAVAVNVPRLHEVGVDVRVLGFALALAIITGTAFGLAPALSAWKLNLTGALNEGGRGTGGGRSRMRNVLIVSQVALALMLLVGTGLLLQSFRRLTAVPPGFEAGRTLTMRFTLPEKHYPDALRRAAFFSRALEKIEALPGVEAAGLSAHLALGGSPTDTAFTIEGRADAPVGGHWADFDFCSPGYFRALGIPLRQGRLFDERDAAPAARAVIVNETLARRHFPGEDPLGKRLIEGKQAWEIVGVVGDVRLRGLGDAALPLLYKPHAAFPWSSGHFFLRTSGPPLALAGPRSQGGPGGRSPCF